MFFFSLVLSLSANAQVVYQHDFGSTTITVNPYTGTPTTINANLSNSSWSNNIGAWVNLSGAASSTGLGANSPQASVNPTTQLTLTFDIAAGKQLEIDSFNFWRRRTPSAAQTWSMTINGIAVGNGSVPTSGTEIGNTNVLNPVTGLTGTVTVVISFNNSTTGSGSLSIDDFTLNGTVTNSSTPPCPLTITSFSPTTGPENTLVTINGTGFNDTTGVTFDGIIATFAAISDTELIALVPAGVTTGTIEVTASAGCDDTATNNFDLLTPECQSDIYISELYDAFSSVPGAVELYNPTSNTINLNGYTLLRYGDIGAATASYTMNLSGSIAAGDTFIVAIDINNVCAGVPTDFDLTNGINANDEFELLKNGILIDNVEVPLGGGNSGKGYTLIREPDAIAPKVNFDVTDWIVDGNEYCSNLDMHTANATGGAPTPDITHPTTQNICENESTTFSVSLTGTGYTYQWKVLNNAGNWVNVIDDANYTGATTNTLNITAIPFSFNENQYYCEITSSTCDLVSNAAQLNVTEAPQPAVATTTSSSCTADTGSITITAPTDFGLSYSINNIDYQFGTTFTDLAPGDYTITVKNLSGCVSTPITVTVENAGDPDVATTTVTQPSCITPTGTITVTAPIGAEFSYSLNGVDFQVDVDFSGLAAGTYNITTMNALGCTSITPDIILTAPATPPVATTTITQPTCDVPTGTIEVTAPIGVGYTYSVNGVDFVSSTIFNSLTPNTYNITVMDAGGCTSITADIIINTVPDAPVLGTINVTQPDCDSSGRIFILSPLGGQYTYSINGTDYQTSPIFDFLGAGTYQVTVQSNTCISTPQEVIINQDDVPNCIENPNLENSSPPSSDANLAAKGSWYTSHGTPDGTGNTITMASHNNDGDGAYTCFNFEAGKEYRVCINLENENTPGTIGYTNANALFYIQASNGLFTPTPTPTGNQVIAGWHATDQTPTDYTYTFTANENYNKLWIFPHMLQNAPALTDQYTIRVHSIKVEEVIVAPTANLVGNTATITGTPTTGGTWSWVPASLVTSQNADNSIVTVNSTCSPEIITATFTSDCEVCSTYTVQITTPSSTLSAPTVTTTQPDCAGTVAQIEITSPTGTGYTYSIGDGYQTSPIFNNPTIGNHNVTVQDGSGCISDITTVTINTPLNAPEIATTTITQPTCTNPNGIIEVTAPIGTDLEYSINGIDFQTTATFTVATGTYNITVKNADDCTSITTDIIINPTTTPAVATTTITQPTCTNLNGIIEVTAPIAAGLEYSINGIDFQTTTTFNTVATGTYNITVRNADNCTSTTGNIVIDPAPTTPAIATTTVTQPTCTNPNGSIEIIAPIDTDLEYSINGIDFQTTTTFTVTTGTYNITVKNAAGCTSISGDIIIDPAPDTPATATTTVTQPTCTDPNGIIEVTAPISIGLEYSINGIDFQTTTTFTVATGTYNITVKNAAGCTSISGNIVIGPAPTTPAIATTAVTQPTCTTSGIIEVTAPIAADLEYSINGIDFQTSTTLTATTGIYNITVRNASGCTSITGNIIIDPAPAIPATATTTITQPTCTNSNGIIEVTAPIAVGLEYSINGIDFQTDTTFTVTTGVYNIIVRNTEGCTSITGNITINTAPTIPADADAIAIQPSCINPLGNITVNSPIGAGLTYSINGIDYQSNTEFSNLAPGNYNVLVKNAAGCVSTTPLAIIINFAPSIPTAALYTKTYPTCTNTTGSITITSPIGTNLEYSINNGADFSDDLTYNNLAPGLYQVIVRNGAGCMSTPVNVIINPIPNTPPDAIVNIVQPSCNTTVGSITITHPVGTGYTYSINGVDYQSSTTFNGLSAGNYLAYVKNAEGCSSNTPTPFIINEAPTTPEVATIIVTNPDCTTATGSLEITAPLGAGLTYSIDNENYQADTVFNDVTSGTYTITVKNADGCISLPTNRTIQPQPDTPNVPIINVQQTDCISDVGKIVVSSPIGFGYTYSINGGTDYQANPTFPNIAPGDYVITVRNAAGCTEVSETITIDTPPDPAPDPGVITGNNTICEEQITQLENIVEGGIWSSSNNSIATVDDTGLVTGITSGLVTISYTVGTICTDSATMIVEVNALPTPILNDQYYLCQDLETQEFNNVILDSELSHNQYSFIWKRGDTVLPFVSGFIIADEPGTYSVEATNLSTGCVGTTTTTVAVSSIAIATAEATVDFSYNQIITVNVTGGSGNYEFSLDGGAYQDDNVFTNIREGLHTVTINDKNGCASLVLEVYALNYPRFFSPNGDGQHDSWNIKGLSSQKDAIIYIFDRYGKVITAIRPNGFGWDGTYNGEKVPATDYWFKILYQSSNGTPKEFKAHFSLLR
ncbi:T9SS type B sorting domain-containing protein [uncultured Flavobacterium sp.]|uniref:T9SS type B sorting domain-containing protein n=1 Tax=uncultured Flavobacterium sp. TaxID=165435 RepID=UPI0025EF4473|nr:T9SS type B sorting domain-containing protein [uncultured Flavobacterium sp.]